MSTRFAGVAVVTGAASGIGRGLAEQLAAEGASLVLADIDEPALLALRDALAARGTPVLAQRTDVSRRDDIDRLRDAALERFGRVDWLFNNAGILTSGNSWEQGEGQWQRVLGVNLWSVIHAHHSFVPLMIRQGRGHVVNTSSIGGLLVGPWIAPYTVSKHGVTVLTEALLMELQAAGHPVRVSLLCPGPVDTGIARGLQPDATPAGQLAGALQGSLSDHGMSPADLARFALDGVAAGRFWLLPHPDAVKPGVGERAQRIASEAPPRFAMS
ncbi:MAG TPA: SDR family NAD(P)-dependent oxidoreductase [Ramlibacter sp.]|nr:SDR family NAD(P)-dependent oxidoreductase [Ramlibacter sp.]